ncbi:PAAR-like domain-containing protein [Archangium violaceum]|uniref:PAAR-like domain-containing protein n=1 Tax=Archangium violaceum TaxID=83451 RepID=UPI002B2E44C0|nr:PAAR-like domain-containing protein [Archangium gephyra]
MSVSVNSPKTPVTEGSVGIAAATLPNMCKMPGPPAPFVPAPLPNIGKSGDSPKGYSTSVTIEGHAIAIKGASFGSMGDAASKGTGGGLTSANTHGPTKFIGPGSLNVKVEGKNVQLLGDPMMNNCGPGGSPSNSATLSGLSQACSPSAILKELKQIATDCNKKINRKAGYKPPRKPSGKECTRLGTKKHKCCEEAIKKADNPLVKSEVGYKKNGQPSPKSRGQALAAGGKAASAAKKAGNDPKAAFRAAFVRKLPYIQLDVVVLDKKGNISRIYDFKFNCSSPPKMSNEQRMKYEETMGRPITLIGP